MPLDGSKETMDCIDKQTTVKISRQDWVTIGLQTLIESGIEAVRVEPLAKQLNVTRGSFYWHFKNRGNWLEALLQEWKIYKTQTIIEKVEAASDDPNFKLLKLFEIVAEDDDRLEQAVRVWAMKDEKAAAALAEIDQRRLNYAENLFQQLGFSRVDAKIRARIAYSVKLSWSTMPLPSNQMERLKEMQFVYAILTQHSKS
ncbi:MAG: TetR/AcrR family transcriptional regulator [Elainellaceae cyanobacterium]